MKKLQNGYIWLKTGFHKYLSVNGTGVLVAVSEAIGLKERWEPIFEQGRATLCSSFNGKFVTYDPERNLFMCTKSKIANQDAFNVILTQV